MKDKTVYRPYNMAHIDFFIQGYEMSQGCDSALKLNYDFAQVVPKKTISRI